MCRVACYILVKYVAAWCSVLPSSAHVRVLRKVYKTDKLGHSDNPSLFPGNCAGNKPPGARQNTQPRLLLWDYEYAQIRVFSITPTGEEGSETKYPPAQA